MKVGELSDLTTLQHKALTTPCTDLLQYDKQSAHMTKWKKGKEVSIQLSVDVGIEPHVFGEDIPVWHVTVTYPKHTRILPVKEWGEFERTTAAELAREVLEGVGGTDRWSLQDGTISLHYRRPLTSEERKALSGILFPHAYIPLPPVEVDPDAPKLKKGEVLKVTVTDIDGNELAVFDDSPPRNVVTFSVDDNQAWAYDLDVENSEGKKERVEYKTGKGRDALQEALHETAEAWGLPEEEIVRLALEGMPHTEDSPPAQRVEAVEGVDITAGDESWQTVIDEAAADLVDKMERRVLGNLLSLDTSKSSPFVPTNDDTKATDHEQ